MANYNIDIVYNLLMLIKTCSTCRKSFYTQEAWERRSPAKFCSKSCFHQGLRGKIPPSLKGVAKKKGNEHPLWKGNNASYESIHQWLTRWYKKEFCIKCGNKQNLEWSNISGKYLRDRADFEVLCTPCHRVFDRKNPKSKLPGARLIFGRYVKCQKYPKQLLTPLS